MKQSLFIFSFLFLCLSFCISQSVVIKAGKLFDARSGKILENQIILIENGVIKNVALDNGKVWEDFRVIDLSKKFVMPGMIDAHVHFFLHPYNETDWNDQVLKESIPLRTLRAGNHAKTTLDAGFTTVRDLGTEGAEYADVSIKEAIDKGIIGGPHYYISSKAIVISGGYGPKGYADHFDHPLGAEIADGIDEMRKVVRSQIGHGADWIKLYADYRRVENQNYPLFSEEEIRVAVMEAATVEKSVSCHANTPEAIQRALRAGVKSIEHGSEADEKTFLLMKEKNATWVPTLAALDAITSYAKTDEVKQRYQKMLDVQKKTFQLGIKLGVNIVCGSDAGVFTHGTNVRELELMVAYGMTPIAAMQSATIKAAELIDNKKKTGAIEKDFTADIIAIDGDPLSHISDLRKVIFVMKSGKIVKQ